MLRGRAGNPCEISKWLIGFLVSVAQSDESESTIDSALSISRARADGYPNQRTGQLFEGIMMRATSVAPRPAV